jgi:hypothetical protein
VHLMPNVVTENGGLSSYILKQIQMSMKFVFNYLISANVVLEIDII